MLMSTVNWMFSLGARAHIIVIRLTSKCRSSMSLARLAAGNASDSQAIAVAPSTRICGAVVSAEAAPSRTVQDEDGAALFAAAAHPCRCNILPTGRARGVQRRRHADDLTCLAGVLRCQIEPTAVPTTHALRPCPRVATTLTTHTAHKNRVPIQQHQLVLACAARQSRVVTRVALARRTECTCVRRAGIIHIIRSPGPALSHTAPQQPPTTHDDVKTLTSSRASWSSPSGGSSPPGARGRSSCTPGRSSTCTGPTTRGPRPPSPRPPSRRSTSSRP